MVEPLVWTETRQRMCVVCGALIGDPAAHGAWHLLLSADHPDPDEAMPRDSWQQALSDEPWDLTDEWDGLLQSAVSLTADAIYQLGGDRETYLECLVFAALRIRAMAPAGTEWLPRYAVGPDDRRRLLRSVLRSLASADETRGTEYESKGLVDAESALHSLWMSGKEQQ